jgi:GNAT superfamily N-acetyltransferase
MQANGYHQLPPGKLANAVTWVELIDPAPKGIAAPPGLTLRRLGPSDATPFQALFREIGRDWLWSSLIDKDEAEIALRLDRKDILSFAAMDGPAHIGLLDMELTDEGAEVVYFGFVPSFIGRGAGAWLMDAAKRICRDGGIGRVWLHTCNFDHPKALAFYQRQGFRIYAVGYEVMDDPRALGLLPKDAAPHVPLVER